jgi:hypothetical protein
MLEENRHKACRDHDPWWKTGKENSGGGKRVSLMICDVNPEGSWEKERTKKYDFDGLTHAELEAEGSRGEISNYRTIP